MPTALSCTVTMLCRGIKCPPSGVKVSSVPHLQAGFAGTKQGFPFSSWLLEAMYPEQTLLPLLVSLIFPLAPSLPLSLSVHHSGVGSGKQSVTSIVEKQHISLPEDGDRTVLSLLEFLSDSSGPAPLGQSYLLVVKCAKSVQTLFVFFI